MVPARSADAFIASPYGAYFAGSTYVVWCQAPEFDGTVVWGSPSELDVREMARCYEFPRQAAPRDVITDARRLASIDPAAFGFIYGYARERHAQLSPGLRRHAVLHAEGLAGAAVAGFLSVIDVSHQWRAFHDVGVALAWLGRAESLPMIARLDVVATGELGTSPVLRALRALLAPSPHRFDLERAAREMGMSTRTVQRALESARTSFRKERDHAWAALATRLLVERDDKVEVIARELGCRSLSTFDVRFARLVGRTPTEHRRARAGTSSPPRAPPLP